MRILVVTEGLLQETKGGGVQPIVHHLVTDLVACGHDVTILTRNPGRRLPKYETRGLLTIYRYPSLDVNSRWRALAPVISMLAAGLAYRFRMRRPAFDIIHYHYAFPAFGVEIVGRPKAIRVFTEHAPRSAEYRHYESVPPFLRRAVTAICDRVEARVLRGSSAVVFLSDYMARLTEEMFSGLVPKHVIIPPGVDIARFQPGSRTEARRELRLPQAGELIVTVRRLQDRMGLETLIEAMKEITARRPGTRLVIVGDGPSRETLIQLVDTLHLKNSVSLVGYASEEELPLYYQAADITVLPTAELEGFGLVILEAFACNKPVLGTPVGAIPDILRSFNDALIFRSTDATDMADLVVRALHEPQSLSLRQNYRALIEERFQWRRSSELHEALYHELAHAVCRPAINETEHVEDSVCR